MVRVCQQGCQYLRIGEGVNLYSKLIFSDTDKTFNFTFHWRRYGNHFDTLCFIQSTVNVALCRVFPRRLTNGGGF